MYHQFPVDLPSTLFDCLASFSGVTDASLRKTEVLLLGRLRPERCRQASLGYDEYFYSCLETRLEAYYKWYDREFNYYGPNVQDILKYDAGGNLEFAEQNGKRKSMGIEATIARTRSGGPFFSFSGSLFEVKNLYQDGVWYNDWSDVQCTFSFAAGFRPWCGHTISLSIQGSGGRPYCPQKITLDCINRRIAHFDSSAEFFARRLDPLVSASVRYAFTRQIHGISVETSIEILNAFNYLPTLEYRFNGERFVEIKPFSITPILGCRILL